MTDSPKITVLMPVYNGEKYLSEAIESILGQTFTDFEFLIIDDGSSDGSHEIIRSYHDSRIRLEENGTNLGIIATLNRGLDLAQAGYIARMDCDDVSLPTRLEKQAIFMDAHPEVGISGTWVETIGEDSGHVFQYETDPRKIKSQLLFDSCLAHPSVIMRKELLEKHDLRYDSTYLHVEDWVLWQEASFCFDISNIPDILLKYRIAGSSVSRAHSERQHQSIWQVHSRNLANLGLSPTEKEVELHMKLGLWDFEVSEEFLLNSKLWMKKLIIANWRMKTYPEPEFSEGAADRFFSVCDFQASRGKLTWRMCAFFDSDELLAVTGKQKWSLFWKSLMHKFL